MIDAALLAKALTTVQRADILEWMGSREVDGDALRAQADSFNAIAEHEAVQGNDVWSAGDCFLAGVQFGIEAARLAAPESDEATEHLRWALRWLRSCDEEPLDDEEAEDHERWLAALKFAGLENEEPT